MPSFNLPVAMQSGFDYDLWCVVCFEGVYYTLMTQEGFDNNIDPYCSDCWDAVADYDPHYNNYDLEGHEYVVYENRVYYPALDVNADVPIVGHNITLGDPRNYNLKKTSCV